MNRRPGSWITGFAALLVVALVAAPVWDAWAYRRLRSPIGPHVPVGVILPLTPPPPAPAPSAAVKAEPASRVGADSAAGPGAAVATVALPSPPAPAAVTAPRALPPRADAVPPAQRRATPPAAAPADAPGRPAGSRGAEARHAHEGTGGNASAGSLGWVAMPVSDGGLQPPPLPEENPAPGPKPVSPVPDPGDPTPTPQAIPTLKLFPPVQSAHVGDTLLVLVRLSGASNVTSLPFHLEFDPAVLEFQSAHQGPAVDAMQPILLASVSPARPGDLAVGLSLVETGGLLQGSGTVIRLQFRAVGPGSTSIGFSRATIRGRTSEPLEARFQNASIEVR